MASHDLNEINRYRPRRCVHGAGGGKISEATNNGQEEGDGVTEKRRVQNRVAQKKHRK